ncbi:MAG: Mrp/NBP35 family ATP-binding protein [Helicobacteraceae bacterium]|jgi:ATP-binding protein involved in chromosome partitioning|nr:Mrp/NBP35 family ATP-binding protein [Helicobacteraceae bacterium]
MIENEIRAVLSGVSYPGFDRNIVSLGFVKQIKADGDQIAIDLEIPASDSGVALALRSEIAKTFAAIGRKNIALNIVRPQERAKEGKNLAPNIKRFAMISSGKGGVGKSSVCVNLAIASAMRGKKVGLLDADIYGPNVPRMLGLENEKLRSVSDKVIPPEAYGVKVMSMGMILAPAQALIWRGPMIVKTIERFFCEVEWGDLDIMFMDMPPGTGDAQLSLAQSAPISAGIVVTTPQEVALDDAKRALDMFVKTRVPIAGIAENMSGFICPHCNTEYDIFGKGSVAALAKEYGTQTLAEIPIEPEIRVGGDGGKPIVFCNPSSETAKRYQRASDLLWEFLEHTTGDNAAIQPDRAPI